MSTSESVSKTSSLIFIQINEEKTDSIESNLSQTLDEFRKFLVAQQIQLTKNTQFLDAHDYPVSIINDKTLKASNL